LFAVRGIMWIFGEHHVATFAESELFLRSVGIWLMQAGFLWMSYISIEPYIRRRWPSVLVSWSRLLAGGFRDSLVGRDLLIGCVMGAIMILLYGIPRAALPGGPLPQPETGELMGGMGSLYFLSRQTAFIAGVLQLIWHRILAGIAVSFMLFAVRVLLKSTWAAAIVGIVTTTAILVPSASSYTILIPLILGIAGCFFVYFRFGLLSFIGALLFFGFLLAFPITAQLSAWYSGFSIASIALLLAIVLYAFFTSLGSQPLFGRASLED
jgi:hypothetical protein